MKKIYFLILLFHIGCNDHSDIDKDSNLASTEWVSAYSFDSLSLVYMDFNSSGNGGNYFYYTDSSCFKSYKITINNNNLIFNNRSHLYYFVSERFYIRFPLYDASNPDSIIGHIDEPFIGINLDTVNLIECN